MIYEGLCIAGPLAGQRIAHQADRYVAVQFPPLLPAWLAADPHERLVAPEMGPLHTYHWRQCLTTAGVVGLWVEEGTDVMQVLLDTYVAFHQHAA